MCQVLDPSPSFGIIRNGYTFRITWALTEAIPSAEARKRLPAVVIAGWSIWNAQNASPNALPASTLPQSLTIDDFMAEHAKRKLVAEPVHGRHKRAACEWDEAERAKEIDTGIQAYQRRASTVLSMNTSRIFTTYSPSSVPSLCQRSVPRSRPKFWPGTQPTQTDSRTQRHRKESCLRRSRGGFQGSPENRQPRNRAMASNHACSARTLLERCPKRAGSVSDGTSSAQQSHRWKSSPFYGSKRNSNSADATG